MNTTSHLVSLAGVSLLCLTSCVSTGSVEETQPLTTNPSAFATPQIVVNASDADWKKDADEFKKVLAEKFQGKAWKAESKKKPG